VSEKKEGPEDVWAEFAQQFDPDHADFAKRIVRLVICGVAAVFGLAWFSGYARTNSEFGTFGDALGGVSNFVTMIVVVASAVYATRQVKLNREQHRREVLAEEARTVWRLIRRHVRHLSTFIKASRHFNSATAHAAKSRASDSAIEMLDAILDAKLYFSVEQVEVLQGVRLVTGAILKNDRPLTPVEEETLEALISAYEKAALEVLGPAARLEDRPVPSGDLYNQVRAQFERKP
jgi:hypothetical protein